MQVISYASKLERGSAARREVPPWEKPRAIGIYYTHGSRRRYIITNISTNEASPGSWRMRACPFAPTGNMGKPAGEGEKLAAMDATPTVHTM